MNAYRVTLTLFEKGEEGDPDEKSDSTVEIITVAPSLAKASTYAKEAYEKADQTVDGFHWEATTAEQLHGVVALPAMRAVVPKT